MLNRSLRALNAHLHSLAFKVLAGLILFYFSFAWLAVNPLAKWLVPMLADSQLASQARVAKVSFDPLSFTATIEQLSLNEKNGAPLASFDRLVVDVEASGLFDWAWKFKQIEFTAPRVNVHLSKQGRFNWADLIAKLNEDPSPPSPDLPRVIVDKLIIQQGHLDYVDHQPTTPLKAAIKPLDFVLEGFSTLPKDRGDYLIAAKLPAQGGTLKWKGNFGVNPVASQGSLAIEGLQVAKLLQWVDSAQWPLQVQGGTFNAQLKYDFSLPNQQPTLLVTDLKLRLNHLAASLLPETKVHGKKLQDTKLQGANISLAQLQLNATRLRLLQQKELLISTEDLTVSLDQLKLQQSDTALSLADGELTLPKLAFAQQAATQVSFDQMNLHVRGLQLLQAEKPLFQLPALVVENVAFNLAARQAHVAHIALNAAQVSATQTLTGLDWQHAWNTLAPPTPAASEAKTAPVAASAPFQFAIDEIALKHWQLDYTDQQFAKPLQASVKDFNLALAVDNQSGLTLKNMQLDAHQLKLQSAHQPAAQLASVNITDGKIGLNQQSAEITELRLSGLQTNVIRQADTLLNWQQILAPAAGKPTVAAAPNTSVANPPWAFKLKRLALQHAEVHVEDQSTPTPVVIDIVDAYAEADNLTQSLARQLPVKAGFHIKQGGQFSLQGKLAAAPFNTALQCTLRDLSLKPFAPYLQQVALLQLDSGTASLQGQYRQTNSTSTFEGGFKVSQLSIMDTASQPHPFVRWANLQGEGLSLSLAPNKLQLGSLTITEPQTQLIIYPDRSLNFAKVMRTPAVEEKPTIAAASPPVTAPVNTKNEPQANAFPVTIDTIRIQDAELEFADLSLPQPFGTQIHSLGGVINGISNNPASTAQVELDGKVDDYGAARIRGALKPFQTTAFTDIKLAFTNLEMNRLTPYSGKFAGRKITSGKLSVDLEYNIKQRKLAGENKFVIHKLTLGEKVDSKEAANLPLDLAIAILEDSDGVIDLDLPVSGSLDDPKFSIGGIVWKAFTNVLTKIVTAPFSALGKLFGGGEKLEAILFDPGKATISPPELEKLHQLSQALSKRQQLKLGIYPGYAVAADTRAIQESTLRKQVAKETGVQLAAGETPGPINMNNPKVQSAIQTLHDRLSQKGLLKRLAAKLEKVPPEFYAQAQEILTTSLVVTETDLRTLADARAAAIQKVLQAEGVSADRVVANTAVSATAERNTVPTKLSLDAIKR